LTAATALDRSPCKSCDRVGQNVFAIDVTAEVFFIERLRAQKFEDDAAKHTNGRDFDIVYDTVGV
jgi:hypothetical protein